MDPIPVNNQKEATESSATKQPVVAQSGKKTEKEKIEFTKKNLPKPKQILSVLNDYIIGQDRAKRVLSVAVYNHYKRLFFKSDDALKDIELQKMSQFLYRQPQRGKGHLHHSR